MAVEIVTGFQGKPHVTANDTACFNQGVIGSGEYVLNMGKKLAATVVTNNQIRIDDGEAVMQGVHFRIHPNTYVNVTIENGNQGVKRKDVIVARYTKERSSGIEKIQIVVVKGTPSADNPLVPSLKKGDIRVGTELNEMLLYVVNIDGLNVTSVTKSFEEVTSIADINKKRLEKLSEIMVATQPGFFVDALAFKEAIFPETKTFTPVLMAGTKGRPVNADYSGRQGIYIRKGDMIFFSIYVKANIKESGEIATVALPVEPSIASNIFGISVVTSVGCTTKPVSSGCTIDFLQKSVIHIWEREAVNIGGPSNYWKVGTNQILRINGYYSLK